MKEQTLIGLSLSGCIRDMAEGAVDHQRVKVIVAGTKWNFPTDLNRAKERYSELEWVDCQELACELLEEFVLTGKVVQPRELGLDALNIAHGHWAVQCRLP